MNRLFGKKSKEADPTLDDASGRVDARVKVADSRIEKIDADLRKVKEQIQRTSGATQQRYKQRAVQLMQQKRTYEKQQDTMMAQQFNIDQLKFTLDTVKDTQLQAKTMKDAHKTLKKDLKKFNLDKIEDLQDDIADMYYDTMEIQEIMGRSYEVPDDIDDAEMMAELDALDAMDDGVGVTSEPTQETAEPVPLPDLSHLELGNNNPSAISATEEKVDSSAQPQASEFKV